MRPRGTRRDGKGALDWAGASTLLALGLLEAAFAATAGTSRWAQAAFTVLWTVPLGWRRRWPIPVFLLVILLGPVHVQVDRSSGVLSYALSAMLACYTVGRHVDPPGAWWGPAMVVGFQWAVITATEPVLDDYAYVTILYGGSWLAGFVIRVREQRLSRLTEETAELRLRQAERERQAVAEERTRIARELHDIVSHSLSVITIQTQSVRLRLIDRGMPGLAAEVADLEAVEAASRSAMAEMRRLLGVLRAAEQPAGLAPQPGLDQLPGLIADSRSAGLPVDLVVDGRSRPLPPGIELAAYRIAQEALTNVHKHAPGSRTAVRIVYGDAALDVQVDNELVPPVVVDAQPGHGLVGMRERVAVFGGTLAAGQVAPDRFSVHASLPLEDRLRS